MGEINFDDETKLITGDDILRYMGDRRNCYEINCSFCRHSTDDPECEKCTVKNSNTCCSCHLCAPCSYCVGSHFEPSPYLLNYRHYKNGRHPWECIRGNKEAFNKLALIEKAGFSLSAETLTTGLISITVEDDNYDYDFEICEKQCFLEALLTLIEKFDVKQEHWTE